jgi:Protein of unknown function (DUF1552)
MSYATSRRTFLRAAGAFAATMPFYRLLERSALGDPPSGPPLRFVGIRQAHGRAVEFWRPQPGFVINGQNQVLQPLDDAATYGKSYKDKLIVIDGIDNVVAEESNNFGHASTPCIWTASTASPNPTCESFETFLGLTKGLGSSNAFPVVQYGHGGAYGAGGVEVSSIFQPKQLFQMLFANFMPPAQQNVQQAADALARGKSTLDFITGSLTSLQNRLAPPEKILLDQHLMAIRQIENRLTAPPMACSSIPAMPADGRDNDGDYNNQTVIQMLVQALACDLTRFIQVQLEEPSNPIAASTQDPGVVPPIPVEMPPTGMTCAGDSANSQDCCHMDVAHKYVASSPATLGGGGAASDITTQVRLARLNKYFASQAATFAQGLDGAGLIDSTVIMTMSDVGNPALHDCQGLPVILLGGANGYFKMGQHVLLSKATPHNAVLVSIANAFGIPITSYGVSANPSTTAGPLPGLTA